MIRKKHLSASGKVRVILSINIEENIMEEIKKFESDFLASLILRNQKAYPINFWWWDKNRKDKQCHFKKYKTKNKAIRIAAYFRRCKKSH